MPHRSVLLRLRRVERRSRDGVVRQIQVERQIRAVLLVRLAHLGRQGPSASASDASGAVRQQTVPELMGRRACVADSCRDRSKDGDRRLACRAECLRREQDSPFRVRLWRVAKWGPCKPAAGQSVASPCVAQAAREAPAALRGQRSRQWTRRKWTRPHLQCVVSLPELLVLEELQSQGAQRPARSQQVPRLRARPVRVHRERQLWL